MTTRTPRIAMDKQLEVLARFSRGDTHAQISKDTGIPVGTLQNIKKRNPAALEIIQNKMIDHQISSAKKILKKSQDLIERKLDKAVTADKQRDDLFNKLISKEIEYKEYRAMMDRIYDPTLSELNAISKESFNQSQIEEGKPTSIPGAGKDATGDLVALVEAIKSGDEVVLQRMVFNSPAPIQVEAEVSDVAD